ncbi:P-loop NTPase fold protein [Okeanomitos corallinicola TIOX110]|uniref:P-loop NTPase fold protein n=2 Tax=Okeanomitos TaxID=3231549 RepID=A0ABZ2UU70_9CYAN
MDITQTGMEAPQNLETATPATEKPFAQFESAVLAVAISPQGRIAVGLEDGRIEIWDILTGEKWVSYQGHDEIVSSVSFSPDGKTLVSGSYDKTIKLWDVETGGEIRTLEGHNDSVFSVSFSPDGKTLASGSYDKTIHLWDVETGGEIRTLQRHNETVISVSFSPNGKTLASVSADKTIKLWDVETGGEIRTLEGHNDSVFSVSFSPDGKTLASGSYDKTIKLWDVETGGEIRTLQGHNETVISVSFSPDGKTLASGSADKTVRLWNLSDSQGKPYIEIGKHEGAVYSVAFDPLGDYIISAGEDGIKVWRWQRFNIHRVSQPFRNDQATGEDSLDVAKELQALADVLMLRTLEPPLAVAIFGSWGSGKSFGMHLIEQQITKIRCQQLTAKQTWGKNGDEPNLSPYVGHVYQIKFNAWSYAKSELWPSLMQTIFDQLDRQLTLEKQLGEVSDLLAGGDVWQVVNQMSDGDRKAILESELSQEVFTQFKNQTTESNSLWDVLSQVRKEEQEKLKQTVEKLENLEAEFQRDNQEIEEAFNRDTEKIENEFNQEVKNIEKNVEQEMKDLSALIVFLSQLKETLKDDFGDSILKDLLNFCGFQDRQDLENQFPMLNLDKLANSNVTEMAQELVEKKDDKINRLVSNIKKINYFLEEQPSNIVGVIEFIKKDKKTLLIFVATTGLPFIAYFVIVSVIPKLLPAMIEISAALQFWLTSVSAIPAISVSIEIFKKVRILQVKTVRFLQVAKENVNQEKQKLAQVKDEKIKDKINKRKAEYEENQVKEIKNRKKVAESEIAVKQQEIEKLKIQIERQKQRVGLTANYKSLLDFVNNRLEDNSYQKFLGIMHQIQDDLADLSEHLSYKPGNTNPEKLKVLKEYFPRGPARIVLYIDDLDRCPPDKVVQVLEAVQLLLNTDLFIIVLAIDDRYIGRALEYIYRGVLKRNGTPSGVDYLEKIIQIPYRMRPINKDITASYLSSLVDINEGSKNENRENFSMFQQVTDDDSILEQTDELDELPEQSYQDEFAEIPVQLGQENEKNLSVSVPSKKSSSKNVKADNSEDNNIENQDSVNKNTDDLVSFERFSAEEFAWISECCQHVDLTPRTAKRLINICKIIKIIWTPTENDTTWKVEPKPVCKQTLIAFLALAGRYPREVRKLLEEIYLDFEETDSDTVIIQKDEWLNRVQKLDVFMDRHNQREWKKFKNDFMKMSPQDEFIFEKRTFNLARSFCFVGDLGYDPDDHYNWVSRVEDGKKIIGFSRNI